MKPPSKHFIKQQMEILARLSLSTSSSSPEPLFAEMKAYCDFWRKQSF
jgi:hypothetical protein